MSPLYCNVSIKIIYSILSVLIIILVPFFLLVKDKSIEFTWQNNLSVHVAFIRYFDIRECIR